jgi:hypothetical protein
VGVQVDQARHDDPRPEVDRSGGFGRMVGGRSDPRQPARGVNLDERVKLVT